MSSKFEEFLKRNSVGVDDGVHPLVHTTKSFRLPEIIESAGLSPSECSVFNETLLYFFVGRPSYKWFHNESAPRDWELPTCFVFDDIPSLIPRRIYPFDSGAHEKKLFPSYVQDMDRSGFECVRLDSSRRIISAFYGSFSNYLKAQPKPSEDLKEEYSLRA